MANLYSMVLLLLGVAHVALALYSWSKGTSSGSRAFPVLMLSMALYATGYAFEIQGTSMEDVLLWSNFQYLGIPFIPALMIMVSVSTLGDENRINRWMLSALFIIPAVTFVMHFSTLKHNLFYQSPQINFYNGFTLFVFNKGPWYLVHTAFLNFAFFISLVLSLRRIARGAGTYRQQAVLCLVASIIPWLVYLVYLAKITPMGLDINPLAFSGSGFMFGLALYRYRLLDLLPIARESVFSGMKDGVLVFDTSNRLVDFNRSAYDIIQGIDRHQLGSSALQVFNRHPSLLEQVEDRSDKMEVMFVKEGSGLVFRSRVSLIRDTRGTVHGKALVLTDVTEQIALLQQLTTMATMDYLTGIPNRRHFITRCNAEIARTARTGKPLSLGIIDLDYFKSINDTYGHGAGDAVLASVAAACHETLRGFDVIGRWGGEEFAVLLPDADLPHAEQIAERLRKSIEELDIPYNGTMLSLTASIGMAEMISGGTDNIDDLMKRADEALYRAKDLGRNRVALYI